MQEVAEEHDAERGVDDEDDPSRGVVLDEQGEEDVEQGQDGERQDEDLPARVPKPLLRDALHAGGTSAPRRERLPGRRLDRRLLARTQQADLHVRGDRFDPLAKSCAGHSTNDGMPRSAFWNGKYVPQWIGIVTDACTRRLRPWPPSGSCARDRSSAPNPRSAGAPRRPARARPCRRRHPCRRRSTRTASPGSGGPSAPHVRRAACGRIHGSRECRAPRRRRSGARDRCRARSRR